MFSTQRTVFSMMAALAVSMTSPVAAQSAAPAAPQMDFLSDPDFQKLPEEQRRDRLNRAWLSRIEPTGKGSLEHLADYVDRYRRAVVYDARLSVLDVTARHVEGTTGGVELTGEVLVEAYTNGLARTLKALGFNVTTSGVALLPDPQLEKSGGKYGIVKSLTGATMRKNPRARAEQINEVPPGGWVRLLRVARASDLPAGAGGAGMRSGAPDGGAGAGNDRPRRRRGAARAAESGAPAGAAAGVADNNSATTSAASPEGWFLAQSFEGYIGFVKEADLERTSAVPSPAGVLLANTELSDGKTSFTAPAGTMVYLGRRLGRTSVTRYCLYSPEVAIPASAKTANWAEPGFTEPQLLQMLSPFVGLPYEWGGTTGQGFDCSGLTQFALRSRGIFLPRDAEEQATVGQIVAWGEDVPTLAQPGDLIFFVNGRGKVSHVAVSLGKGRMIHSHNGSTSIDDLKAYVKGEEGVAERVIFARRVVAK